MNNVDKEYFRLLNTIIKNGRTKHNRTGIDTIGVFGEQAKFDVSLDAFPILTTKKVWFKGIVHELLWFISGSTNIKYLVDNNVHIWDEWAYKRYLDKNKDICGFVPMSLETFVECLKDVPNNSQAATEWGELGEGTYGGMWRAFPYHNTFVEKWEEADGSPNGYIDIEKGTVDQIQNVLNKLKNNPDDRRMIVSAWHPYWVDHCALPPCHCLFHFNTEELTYEEREKLLHKKLGITDGRHRCAEQPLHDICDGANIPRRRLNLLLYQRSCDTALGIPYNITSYALLLAMVAQCVNMIPGQFIHTYGDLHVYTPHIDNLKIQMSRNPYPLPKLWLNPEVKDLFSFGYNDIKLIDYQSHPKLNFDVAV